MWLIYAAGSAVFAALTSVLAKIGINGVNSNLATAIRTFVVLIMAWGIVFLTGGRRGIGEIGQKKLAVFNFVGAGDRRFMALL